ncbi:hypothetical protein ES703_98582 [subsurface metagenome]
MQGLLFLLLRSYFQTFRNLLDQAVREDLDLRIQSYGKADQEVAEHISRAITRTTKFNPVDYWDHDYLDH